MDYLGVANANKYEPMEHILVDREEVKQKLPKLKTGVDLAPHGGAGKPFC